MRDVFRGSDVLDPYEETPGIAEPLGTSIILSKAHIPYRIITSETKSLAEFRTIIVNDAIFLSDEETNRLRDFVERGGVLIATGMTSYYNLSGETSGDFGLNDVFGVSYSGQKSMSVSYLALPEREFVFSDRPAPLVKRTSAESLAKVSQPLFPAGDENRYASIHSNPPGPVSEYDGLTINKFGEGACIYLYSSVLTLQQDAQQSFGKDILRRYAACELIVSCNAPSCVEITILRATTNNSYLLCFVNYQDELPNIPVHDLKTTIRLPEGLVPTSCRTVSDNKTIDCEINTSELTVELPKLDTIEMIEVV